MKFLLALRALFFVLLLPGTVAGYIPFSILRAGNLLRVPDLGLASVCAAVFAIAGALVLLRCVWDFFAAGKGTLAPIDPPRFLVVRGLYRFTRNPMYNGVVAIILGQAWLFGSIGLAKYALGVLILFHLFVVLYEEPALESQFGESYRAYRRAVPRWGFTTRPFLESTGSTRLGWMGVKTRQFDQMNTFYRDVLNLEVLSIDDKSGRFRLGDGTEVHVYSQLDEDHDFFGSGPVVALEVGNFAAARARMLNAGIKFAYEQPQRASGKIWQHFIAPDGNVYEIIGNDFAD